MKKFIIDVVLFCSVFLLICLAGVLLPPTPASANYMYFTKIKKDSLLMHVQEPRMIFIGGSNLAFGLNSQMIRDSLNVNPINTGVHARIGLIYMMDNTLPYIKEGDVVIISPEYEQFYGDFAYGADAMVHTVLDVSRSSICSLRIKQWVALCEGIPQYSLSKFDPAEHFKLKPNPYYSVNSFNEYGDESAHWSAKHLTVAPYEKFSDKYNPETITELIRFRDELQQKGAKLLIVYPDYQASSFNNCRDNITKVESELTKTSLTILGSPERYEMPDSLMFDTPYHLVKEGVDQRTKLLICDIRQALLNTK